MIKQLLVLVFGLGFIAPVWAQYGIGRFEARQLLEHKIRDVMEKIDINPTERTSQSSIFKDQSILEAMVTIAQEDRSVQAWINELSSHLNSEAFQNQDEKTRQETKSEARSLIYAMVNG